MWLVFSSATYLLKKPIYEVDMCKKISGIYNVKVQRPIRGIGVQEGNFGPTWRRGSGSEPLWGRERSLEAERIQAFEKPMFSVKM